MDNQLSIVRIAVGDQTVEVEFRCGAAVADITATVTDRAGNRLQATAHNGSRFSIDGLMNRTTYTVALTGKAGGETVTSNQRLFACGPVPGVTVSYVHPQDTTFEPSGYAVGSPCLLKLEDGRYLASHDIFKAGGAQNYTMLYESADGGKTWSYVTHLTPCFWGKLFVNSGKLYMMGTTQEYGHLVIYESGDWGRTWSNGVTLLQSKQPGAHGPHQAPTPVVRHQGRIWTAFEYGSWYRGGHAIGAISAPEQANLMDPASWTVTPFTDFSYQWEGVGPRKPGSEPMSNPCLEGNIVISPTGDILDILRFQTEGLEQDYGKVIAMKLSQKQPDRQPEFYKVLPFLGNLTKFDIRFNPGNQTYYAIVNRVLGENLRQRNVATLISSKDLEHWTIQRDLLNYQDNNWHERDDKVGFQYISWQFEGDDIIALCRTAINGAHSYHDANHLTFHRWSIEQRRI